MKTASADLLKNTPTSRSRSTRKTQHYTITMRSGTPFLKKLSGALKRPLKWRGQA